MLLTQQQVSKEEVLKIKENFKNFKLHRTIEAGDFQFTLATDTYSELIFDEEDPIIENASYSYDYLLIETEHKSVLLNTYESTLFYDLIEILENTLTKLEDLDINEQIYTMDSIGEMEWLDYEILVSGFNKMDSCTSGKSPIIRIILEAGVTRDFSDMDVVFLTEEETLAYIELAKEFYKEKVKLAEKFVDR